MGNPKKNWGPLTRLIIVASGLIVASGSAAILLTVLLGTIGAYPAAFLVITCIAFVLGLPGYLIARSARRDTPLIAVALGFVIAAIIPALLILSGTPDSASSGGVATVVNGSYTLTGWLQNLVLIVVFGGLGATAGLFFWWLVRRNTELHRERPASKARAFGLAGAALAFVLAAFVIPEAVKDRSCHNPLRGGGDSIHTIAGFDIAVGPDQWEEVAREVEAFGRDGDWAIRSDIRAPETGFPWLQISLCREPGTNIFVQGTDSIEGTGMSARVSVSVYQPQGGPSWKMPFARLYARMKPKWPRQVSFETRRGEPIPPDWTQHVFNQDLPKDGDADLK